MADLGDALRDRLLADSAVAAVVGTKVSWQIVPASSTPPYIVLSNIGGPRERHLKGPSDLRQRRVQAECCAAKHRQATELAELVIAALTPAATQSGVRFGLTQADEPRDAGGDLPGGTYLHRTIVDLLVTHRIL